MSMNHFYLSRRDMLTRAGMGFGLLALADLLQQDGPRPNDPSRAGGLLSATGKARSVIFLFRGGGPSQVDTWAPKPVLHRLHGQNVPESIGRDVPRIARAPL